MKSVVVSTVIIALAGGTWTWVSPRSDQHERKTNAAINRDERVGVTRMLTAREDLKLANLVVGSDTASGLRNFRARLIEDGRARPVFGQARRLCSSAPNVAECWEIAHFHVDGKPRDISLAADQPNVPNIAEPIEDEDLIETGDVPSPAPSADPKAVAVPTRATHLVARPIINARSGPGVSNPVLFKLSKGDRLGQIAEENGWGKFVILEGESSGSEAWAALSILEVLP